MRRIIFAIAVFLFSLTSVMGQKIPINLPADGNWPTIVGDSIMIIGPLQNDLTEEQRYFNPVYMIVYPGKEHLQAQMIRAGACDCDLTKPNRRIGVFSVAPDKQVSFSQGNLQYLPAINLWKFANTQYEYLGNANNYLKPTFRNWVDLFGWSANNTTAPFGVSTSTNAADYAGDFVDWGTNTICGDAPNTWRTLSVDEWDYLFKKRTNAAQFYSKGSIEGTRGMIVLPDNWALPEGVQFTVDTANLTMDLDLNAYSYAEWQKMEDAGAVFLCVTGRRDGKEVGYLQEYGGYWSSTTTSITTYHWFFNYIREVLTLYDNSNRVQGRSVRLVHDTIVPQTIPEPCLIVKVNDTLSTNMMCVEGGTFQMGATPEMDPDALAHEAPVHSVTLSDYYIGQIEVTQALWKTVMGTNPSTIKDNNRPVNNVSWADCQVFIEKLNQKTGYSFRLPTEAEWEYAARGGNKSRGYKYAGSDNIDEVAWYKDNSGGKYQPSALKKPNELGIYDMSGNVFEWCQDWYGPYSADAQVNPQGPKSGPYHMIRGGGWKHIQSNRVTYRRTTGANLDITSIGLRLVLDDTALTPPEPEYVDLGLSVKWATFNVGATSPEDYGDYFAWGETEPKETYSWATYKWCEGTDKTMTKYCSDSNYGNNGFTDNKMELDLSDDAARANWGGNWRMPTDAELTELREQCTWTWTTQDGVNGYKVTSKKSGYTDKSIFLPAAGYRFENSLRLAGEYGYFWSNSLTTDGPNHACFVRFGQYYALGVTDFRRYGFAIRPVYDDRPPKRIGVFSVAADKQVSFSQGNLQYTQSTDTWQFANNQLEYMGNKHFRNGQLADTIEYFGWSGKDSKAPWGISLSTESSDYEGEFLDWGTNTIAGSAPNTWRTLSNDEWNYICQGRKNAANLLGFGKIDTISGLIILPDDWVAPDGITFTPNIDNPNSNPYNLQQWTAMENAGAVFIPPTGYFNHKMDNMRTVHQYGYYRTSTLAQDGRQIFSLFSIIEDGLPNGLSGWIVYSYSGNNQGNLFYAYPVRLVHDTIVPETIPEPCLVVKVNDTLSINMMCVEDGTFMMGAMESDKQAHANEKPAHQVTLTYDYYIGQTEVTQALWQAVMGNNPSTMIGDDLPVNNVLWEEADAFVKRLSQMTGYTFHLPTEAEWEFAARGGNKSQGYLYAGSNNIQEVAWYGSNSGNTTQPVGTKQPNELGIYDMSGNVIEWCSDWLGPYSAEAQVNPIGPATGAYHVYCGGCWYLPANVCRCTHRRQTTAGYGEAAVGLRVVLREKVEPEAVDLGLSVKWANFNIGAFDPTHYGDYFAWGETEPKETYSWATYKWCDGTDANITKYNSTDGKIILEPADDAAQVHWGGNWRMPTKEELQELIDSCQWERVTLNSVIGNKITGPNGNSIFIPAAGSYNSFDNQLHSVGSAGWLYSSSAVSNTLAREINIGYSGAQSTSCSKCVGLTIRPVYDDSYYCYGFTQEDWDAATSSWGHQGRGHAPADQSCIQETMVHGIRLKVAKAGSLNVYKVPSLLEKNEDHFELVATLTTDSTGVQDFDFAEPIYIAPNEYLVFGKPSEEVPTLQPCFICNSSEELPAKAKGFAHYIGTDKAKAVSPNCSLMVEFY